MADERPEYQYGVGTIGGSQFHWGSGTPGKYWSIPYGDYPVTPNAPTGAWAQQAGAIPLANNVIPDPLLGRNRIGIMIHSGSAASLDALYTQGCFKVAPQEWPAVRSEILKEAADGPLYLHVQPGGVASFTNTKTLEQASMPTANAPGPPARPATTTTGPLMFGGLNPGARGMRNNNPGNLIANDFTAGLPGYKGSDGKFAIFDTPEHGAAALDRNLSSYASKGINTPLGVASTWAPAGDNNDPNSYAARIAKSLGIGPNDKIDLSDPTVRNKVGQAIGLVENGPGNSPGFRTAYTGYGTTLNSPPATAGGPAAPAATPAPGTTLPGFQPGSKANEMAQAGLKTLGLGQGGQGGGGADEPPKIQPPPMVPAQAVGGAMMMGPGGQNTMGQRMAEQALAQKGFLTQPSLAAFTPGMPQQPMTPPGAATGIPGLPGTTLNSPSQLQMALMTGAMNPYDLYGSGGYGGAGGFQGSA